MINQDNQTYQLEEKTGRLVSVIEATPEQKNQKMSRIEKLGSFLSDVVLGENVDLNQEIVTKEDNLNQESKNENIQEDVPYWNYTGETYHGIYPPKDVTNSIWMPVDEVSQVEMDENTSIINPVWEKVSFNFESVINRIHYEDMIISMDGDSIVSVYESQIDALKQENVVTNFDFSGSILGYPERLMNDTFVKVEDFNNPSILAEELVFPLLKGETVVGYVNGKTVVETVTQNGAIEMLQSNNQEGNAHES